VWRCCSGKAGDVPAAQHPAPGDREPGVAGHGGLPQAPLPGLQGMLPDQAHVRGAWRGGQDQVTYRAGGRFTESLGRKVAPKMVGNELEEGAPKPT
jgi:hypothetical protein